MSGRRIILCGGGTGGHLYPALVVGRKLVEMAPDLQLLYVGTGRDVEKKIVEKHGVVFRVLRIEGLKGRGLKSLRGLLLLPLAFLQSLALLAKTRPSLVVGVGGYSSGPIVLLASWFGVPTLILEQNSTPGFTNRTLARWVRKAVVSFESTLGHFKGKGVLLGNPVREEFYAVPPRPERDGLAVLVFGGSQGSRFLNERMTAALPLLAPKKASLKITHQTGERDRVWVEDVYRSSAFPAAEVGSYFSDMPRRFAEADLIVSRAGATTLAEIVASRRAAVLVPFAGASEDHQMANARELERVGAVEVIPEETAFPEALAARILDFLADKGRLAAMEAALEPLRRTKAADEIAALGLSLMKPAAKEATA
jgi:UDP-N-acetylglucosamine--N-acetylmuramyl-(pentapeptide) pyrophosphoryl-undecaprenol N-acetylglucosamine transferase